MSTKTPDTNESIELDERDVRALTQYLTVIPEAPGIYEVVSQSGSAYTVDARDGHCTCPDHTHRGARCKHLRRVAFATGERPIPAWIDRDAVDELLGEHTQAVTDGGEVVEDPIDEVLPDKWLTIDEGDESDENAGDGRPEDCSCWNPDGELCCFPCFCAGVEVPNPNASDE